MDPRSGRSKGGCSKGVGSKGGWGPNPDKVGAQKVGDPKFHVFFFFDRGFSFILQDTTQNEST